MRQRAMHLFLEALKAEKESWSKKTPQGFMPPLVAVEKDGAPFALIRCPNNLQAMLAAARIVRQGLQPSGLSFVLDSLMCPPQGDTMEESYKNLYAQIEQGTADTRVGAVTFFGRTSDGTQSGYLLRYCREGQDKPLTWQPTIDQSHEDVRCEKNDIQYAAFHETLKRVMEEPLEIEKPEVLADAQKHGLSPDQARCVMAMESRAWLESNGYQVMTQEDIALGDILKTVIEQVLQRLAGEEKKAS